MAIDEFALGNAAVVDRRFVYQNRVVLQEIVNLKTGQKVLFGYIRGWQKSRP